MVGRYNYDTFLGIPVKWTTFEHPGPKTKAIKAFWEESPAKHLYVVRISADLSGPETCRWRITYATGREAQRFQRKLRLGWGPPDRSLDKLNRQFEKLAVDAE